MNSRSTRAFDVFLSSSPVDESIADAVRRELEAAGLSVFTAENVAPEEPLPSAIRRGIQESVAFVALLTPSHLRSNNLALEVGAAWVWSTPIYVLLSDLSPEELPPYLRHYPSSPLWSGLRQVVEKVRQLASPLTSTDRQILTEVYQGVGVSVDKLITEPAAVDELAVEFSSRSHRHVPPSRLVRELLRIRKTGKLPKLAQRAVG